MGFHNDLLHSEKYANSYSFLCGWGIVAVLTVLHPPVDRLWGDKLLVAFFAGCTICLLRQADFPKRDLALKTSWIGPLFVAAYGVIYHYYFESNLNNALYVSRPTAASNALAANMMVGEQIMLASFEGSLMIWLFRGYGLLLVCAVVTTLWQGPVNIGRLKTDSLKEFFAEAINDYPAKGWWFPAAVYTLMHLFIAYLIFRTLRV